MKIETDAITTQAITFARLFDMSVPDLGKPIDGIEIPMLQRDYAQGRTSPKVDRVRRNFLDALHLALTPDGQTIELDFIYGSVERIVDNFNEVVGERYVLNPLDGQQRLTTLYLLHWYVAQHEHVDVAEYSFLKKFTYSTRFSSRDFCRDLVTYQPDFEKKSISEGVIDQPWFMMQWKQDPTITSMLVMLDAIHTQFQGSTGLWSRLTDPINPAVSFYFLPIAKMGQTDSLYIKMNSRGKPLTDFEHFKAEFEKILKDVNETLYDEFIGKMDLAWTDMLWLQKKEGSVLIDGEFMRYFRFTTEVICYQQDIPIENNDIDLAKSVYGSNREKCCENVRFLFDAIDCWATVDIERLFSDHLAARRYEPGKVKVEYDDTNLFRQCCLSYGIVNSNNNRVFTLNSTLMLYAFVAYRINQVKDQISTTDFAERIRIIRNLIANSSFEIRSQNMGQLLEETKTIVTQAKINLDSVSFSKAQKEEEHNKLRWRREWSNHIPILNEVEDHYLLDGAIAIIGLANGSDFEIKARAFMKLFDRSVSYDKIKQVMLCLDDYSQKMSERYIFGGDYDSSWRELLTVSLKRSNFNNTVRVLTELLKKSCDGEAITFDDVITNYLEDPATLKGWRYYFVMYPEMRKGKSGVFYWKNGKQYPYDVLMMNTPSALNGKHWNPFHYTVACRFREVFSLEDYGSPLVLRATGHRVISTNDAWVIKHPSEDVELLRINIGVNEQGVDNCDRIDVLRERVKDIQELSLMRGSCAVDSSEIGEITTNKSP